jgi:hypothetical protein
MQCTSSELLWQSPPLLLSLSRSLCVPMRSRWVGFCPAPCYTSFCTLSLQDCKARQACVPHPTAALLRCHRAQVATARAALPGQVKVVCVAQDDSWFRDTGPTVGHAACSFTAAVLLPCAAALLLFVW